MSSERTGAMELVADIWLMIMGHLSTFDLVSLSQTCKTLFSYSQVHHVWRNALLQHRFLPKTYPHLRTSSTEVIRRQLITTARLDTAYSQDSITPIRSYSFPIDFPGVFQGLRFLPGGRWMVLMFHSRTLNPARHSNLCLFRPQVLPDSDTQDSMSSSVSLQSEQCWLPLGSQDGPYKSSRGHDLLLLRTFVKNERTFGICHLDTKTPSIKVTFMFHTSVFVRNYITAGDFILYGWITDDRRHMVRIMKLNENYTALEKDVTMEIDCPPGHDGKLGVHYDLRLSGKVPRILLISTRLMAAYDIPDTNFIPESSPQSLSPMWIHSPSKVSFGRILQVFREASIVTLYEGKIRFIRPELDDAEPNSQITTAYNFSHTSKRPAVFDAQRIFWHLWLPGSLPAAVGSRNFIETSMLPLHCEECDVRRVLIDHKELPTTVGYAVGVSSIVEDWDELSGRLCVRYVRSRFPHDHSWRKMSCRIAVIDIV
ncbi:hypothetical protein F5I97DRAFT_1909083 [Phlebopus sp. FC_14]|nr:hypothetical protein F5I97DRAFT_1909083 [Phlebopus sp. FC_14]